MSEKTHERLVFVAYAPITIGLISLPSPQWGWPAWLSIALILVGLAGVYALRR